MTDVPIHPPHLSNLPSTPAPPSLKPLPHQHLCPTILASFILSFALNPTHFKGLSSRTTGSAVEQGGSLIHSTHTPWASTMCRFHELQKLRDGGRVPEGAQHLAKAQDRATQWQQGWNTRLPPKTWGRNCPQGSDHGGTGVVLGNTPWMKCVHIRNIQTFRNFFIGIYVGWPVDICQGARSQTLLRKITLQLLLCLWN